MTRIPRTTMTWRFENPMAPDQKNYLPCPVLVSELVMVTITLFMGKATMVAWFASLAAEPDKVRRDFLRNTPLREQFISLEIRANGDSFCLEAEFWPMNGEEFTHTACKKFLALCDEIGNLEYRKRFYLPHPEVSQETMVEMSQSVWYPYGMWLWETHFAAKADELTNLHNPL